MKQTSFYLKTALILLGAMQLFACSQPKPNQIVIECQISGIPDSAKVSLGWNEGMLGHTLESGYFKDGKITLTYTPDSLDVLPMRLFIYGDSLLLPGRLDLYAGLGTTRIAGDGNYTPSWKVTNDTPEQTELNKMEAAIAPEAAEYHHIQKQISQLYTEKIYRGTKIDSLYKLKEVAEKPLYQAELNYLKTLKSFNAATLDKFWQLLLFGVKFDNYIQDRIEEAKAIYPLLTPEQQNSLTGEEIKAMLYPPKQVAMGDTLPDNTLYDITGKAHKLSDYRGKYLILDFWSSGCGPCLMAGPEIAQVQEKYKDKLTIISISTDYRATWEKATQEHNLTWTNLSDYKGRAAGFCAQFTFLGVPYFLIADPSGQVIAEWFGYKEGIIEEKTASFLR